MLVADDHPRAAAGGDPREAVAALSGGDDVRADVAERRQTPVLGVRGEAAEAAPGDVLEEDPLHRILRAEREDLLEPWFDRVSHGSNGRTG